MQEIPKILLEETSELLDELIPIVQRNINALQHDSSPLLQHLIQQEIEGYQQLLERTEETRNRFQDLLNPQKVEQEEAELEEVELEEVQPQEDGCEDVVSEQTELEEDELQEGTLEVTESEEDISPRYISPVSDMPGYPPGGNLAVTMPNGEKIRHRYAPDTFVEVLEKIGLERVRKLGIMCRYAPLVDTIPNNNVRQRQSGGYYVTVDTHHRYMTKILWRIAATFDIDLVVGNRSPDERKRHKKYSPRKFEMHTLI